MNSIVLSEHYLGQPGTHRTSAWQACERREATCLQGHHPVDALGPHTPHKHGTENLMRDNGQQN